MRYYHITKERHLPRIFTEGLRPGHRVGLTVRTPRKVGKVFVTNDVAFVAANHAGRAWCEKHNAVVLAVELYESEREPVRYYSAGTYTISNFEFTCNKVPVERLRYVGTLAEFLAQAATRP
jgi:hypothetical protein